ncbi:hypothetical protein [Paenibacillus sp. MER 99-2]|uniref:hypothetical protein n=1 Tax=Paenibacillus sp. MER 99-2 TaxID=2939572 RepID=UPI00203D6414|nr:hypothetical protein [Paenibacillus sp. MER 99-2]MCM3172941.1 hypothetical protein [Paenibacillus sp. MER 99-2]
MIQIVQGSHQKAFCKLDSVLSTLRGSVCRMKFEPEEKITLRGIEMDGWGGGGT